MADGPQNKWSSDEYWESPRHPLFSFKGFLHIHVYFGSAATFAQILWRKLWIAVDWNHASRAREISWEYNEEAGKGPLHLYWGQESILGIVHGQPRGRIENGSKKCGKAKGRKLPKSNVRSLPAVVAGPPFAVSLMSLSHWPLKTRPNWARKVRELILFNILCTVYCGRGCLSLESEGKE